MAVDLAAYRSLFSNRLNQKTCVTRVTCVTSSKNNDLADHSGLAERVTCLTGVERQTGGHTLREHVASVRVTKKTSKYKAFELPVTQSRGHARKIESRKATTARRKRSAQRTVRLTSMSLPASRGLDGGVVLHL